MVYRGDYQAMKRWLVEEMEGRGFKKVVIGLSGGFDSSLAAFIASSQDCLGPDNVFGVLMPCESSQDSIDDAEDLAHKLDIEHQVADLNFSYFHLSTDLNYLRSLAFPQKLSPVELGNIKARMRMMTLYTFAVPYNALVLNTSNLSEIMSGNGTKFGDGAGDIALFHNYTKTEMYEFAKDIDFDAMFPKIYNKIPSADLEPNQTDEGTMGVSYAVLDAYLRGDRGVGQENMDKIEKLIKKGAHKREKMPSY